MNKVPKIVWSVQPCDTSTYNSNNAWGFGGVSGYLFKFESGVTVLIGDRGTRHMGTYPVLVVRDRKGVRLLDTADPNKKDKETMNKLIKEQHEKWLSIQKRLKKSGVDSKKN